MTEPSEISDGGPAKPDAFARKGRGRGKSALRAALEDSAKTNRWKTMYVPEADLKKIKNRLSAYSSAAGLQHITETKRSDLRGEERVLLAFLARPRRLGDGLRDRRDIAAELTSSAGVAPTAAQVDPLGDDSEVAGVSDDITPGEHDAA